MGLMELPQAAGLNFDLADGSHGLLRVFERSGRGSEFLSNLEVGEGCWNDGIILACQNIGLKNGGMIQSIMDSSHGC